MIRRPPGAGPEEGACPDCAHGDVWYGPTGTEVRLCAKREWLVAGRPEWRRAGVQVNDVEPPWSDSPSDLDRARGSLADVPDDQRSTAEVVVAALARRYAFVEHAEMAALRAVVDELRTIHREYRHLRVAYCATCCDPDTDRPLTYPCPTVRALDALPPADAKEARS